MIIHKTRKIGATKTRNSRINNIRWLWFITGLGTGLLLSSFLIGLSSGEIFKFTKAKPTKLTIIRKNNINHSLKTDKQENTENAKNNINYDFYKLLPQQAPEYHIQSKETSNVPIPPKKAVDKPTKNIPVTSKKIVPIDKTLYILHVGEFSSLELADQAKAKLALHGIDSNITVIKLPTIKYLVIVSSSYNKNDVLQKKLMLTKLNISTFLINR